MTTQNRPWYTRLFKETSSDMWQRLLPLWHLAVFGQLLVVFVFAINGDEPRPYNNQIWAILHLAFIVWYSFGIQYSSDWWRERQLYFVFYLMVGWSIWWMLIMGSSSYFILLGGLFPQLFIYLTFRNAMLGTIALNCLMLLRLNQVMPELTNTWLLMMLLSSTGAIILGYFIETIIKQSENRRNLIEALQETRAQLAKAERLNGIAQERQRLAADLHDTLVQSLISVVTHLEAAENVPEYMYNHLQIAKQAARDSLHDARQVIWDLQLPSEDADTFQKSLRVLCLQWKQRSQLAIEFTQAGDPICLSDETQHAIRRITQESFANISRHAQATQVFVTLKFTDEHTKLFIMDDGIGFDSSKMTDHGNGIANMKQRAQSLNGNFLIESDIGKGTTITITLPIQATLVVHHSTSKITSS